MTRTADQIIADAEAQCKLERASSDAYIVGLVLSNLQSRADAGDKRAANLVHTIWEMRENCDRVCYQIMDSASMAAEYVGLREFVGPRLADVRRCMPAEKSKPVTDSRCNYVAGEGNVCNKCGNLHDGGDNPVIDWVPNRFTTVV